MWTNKRKLKIKRRTKMKNIDKPQSSSLLSPSFFWQTHFEISETKFNHLIFKIDSLFLAIVLYVVMGDKLIILLQM